jgi:hypothetical protein
MIAPGLVQRASGRYFVRTLASMVKNYMTGKGLLPIKQFGIQPRTECYLKPVSLAVQPRPLLQDL